MVSAAGLLFVGVQTKNLHLADRVRNLMREYRETGSNDRERRQAISAQVVLFEKRIRLSQRALESLYGAIVCFVMTTLLLAVAPWTGQTAVPNTLTGGIFILGIAGLLIALFLELLEMRTGLRTIAIETSAISDDSRPT